MSYKISDIATILQTSPISSNTAITELCTDSRKLTYPETSLFFALLSARRDGHDFLAEAYRAGVRAFVVSRAVDEAAFPGAIFLQVPDTLLALQQLAAHHRLQFQIPVIGITGSNGKTIVKEWLYQLLQFDHNIVRSPRSYNSQLGVPLSVWKMRPEHSLGIFEAGISQPGEMERLQRIIRPTIGVLTHMGAAHDEGFSSRAEKLREKQTLFVGAAVPAPIGLKDRYVQQEETWLVDENGESIAIPFQDEASVENALTCWSVMRLLGYSIDTIRPRMRELQPVQMRLEIKKGIQQCLLLNDAYSFDLDSLSIALGHLRQQSGTLKRTVILSDLPGGNDVAYAELIDLLLTHGITRLLAIGPVFQDYLHRCKADIDPTLTVQSFSDREAFEKRFSVHDVQREAILLKGARRFELEKLLPLLESQLHQTRMEIDLGALRHNIRAYQAALTPGVKIMAMVKSFAYGSGGVEIARVMQEEGIAYLGVAYADEGVALRSGGIRLPIMVMNTETDAFDSMLEHRLEPVLYSMEIVKALRQYLSRQGELYYPVHVEFETGMNRLGIPASDLDALMDLLYNQEEMQVRTVFTHLASADDPAEDPFTLMQVQQFDKGDEAMWSLHGNFYKRHIANSAAAIRKPEWQLDMVRIGIGLYGIDPAISDKIDLRPVARLLATVAQVKELKQGDSVSYNRRFVADRPMRIATIRLGYADGYPRRLGNGVGYVRIGEQKAPVLGAVCMDMFMVDVTNIPDVAVGAEVIVFGPELPLTELAKLAGTIPYEIMAGISQRVKRVYVEES